MTEQTGGLRRATPEEILAERRASPLDLWYEEFIDLTPEVVGGAACRLWGAPDADGVEGDLVWKLWSDRCHAVVCIVLGPLRPAVLFSDGQSLEESEDERLATEIRGMLLEAGNR
ncbi:MAG: hypothetical protein WCP21_04635 [Armatimonadota bacterium]